jgi:hypothetical protein
MLPAEKAGLIKIFLWCLIPVVAISALLSLFLAPEPVEAG